MRRRATRSIRIQRLGSAMLLALAGAPAGAQLEPPTVGDGGGLEAVAQDGPRYLVTGIRIVYEREHPDNPAPGSVLDRVAMLGRVSDGFVTPREGAEPTRVNLQEIASRPPEHYYASGVGAIVRAVLAGYNELGLYGVVVQPHPDDIDLAGDLSDLRPPEDRSLRLLVKIGRVSEIRTLGVGPRLGGEAGTRWIGHAAHAGVAARSPVQAPDDELGTPGSLLWRSRVDDYVHRLNRHPGRRVDVAVTGGSAPGEVAVDYLVSENKPWTLYAQVSNTGTEQTNEWRQRFGFAHNQLTNSDDTLAIDYITAGFEDAHAIVGSYERPLFIDKLRGRIYGDWSEYTASDVGQSGENFNGQSYGFGGELNYNVWQHQESFIDLFAGARFEHVQTENEVIDLTGETDFFLPYFGARFQRENEQSRTYASLGLEFNVSDIGGTDADELDALGRLNTEEDWTTFRWDVTHSMYLEPLLIPNQWADTGPNGRPTLAHELQLSFRGQTTFGNRLIPQEEQVVGGLYTVRGYDESAVAGDTALIASAEYRFHVARALGRAEPGTLFGKPAHLFGEDFRWHPQNAYGQADWDLVMRGFLDVARVINQDRQSFERDETLIGTGIGAELVYRRNLSIRLDWGVALEDAGDNDAGDNRVHIVATILF